MLKRVSRMSRQDARDAGAREELSLGPTPQGGPENCTMRCVQIAVRKQRFLSGLIWTNLYTAASVFQIVTVNEPQLFPKRI